MSDVDKLQNAEEAVAQLEQERKEAAAKAQREDLMQEPVKQTASHDRSFFEVPIGLITTSTNMRTGELPEIEGLAISIREVGLLHPLLVRDNGDGSYRLVAGRRRFAALKLIHEKDKEELIPCEVISSDTDEAEAWVLMLTENLQREDPPPMNVARALRAALHLDPDLAASALARSLGKSPAWASRHLHLLDLPDSIQWRLEAGDLNFTIADLIRQGQKKGIIEDEQQAEALADEMASGDKSIAELKGLVRPKGPGYVPPLQENHEELARELDAARYGAMERGFEPDEVGMDAEQKDWEAGSKDDYVPGSAPKPKVDPWDDSASTANLTPAQKASREKYGARQLESYLLGRLLTEKGSPQLLRSLGVGEDNDVYEFVWALGTASERQKVLHDLAVDLMDLDEDLPEVIFGARS